MKVDGAAALITGANRGLGAAIAQALLDSCSTSSADPAASGAPSC